MNSTNIEWGKEWGEIKTGLGKRGSGQTTETRSIFNYLSRKLWVYLLVFKMCINYSHFSSKLMCC